MAAANPDAPASVAADKKSAPPGPMPNRPGEPEFKLEMSPDNVTFLCTADKKPVWCDVKLKNTTSELQSFKVKCTSADIFRVQPPLGLVKAGETQNIRVWFQNKSIPDSSAKHYFAVYHMKTADGKAVKDVWTRSAKPEGVRRLAAVFADKPTA